MPSVKVHVSSPDTFSERQYDLGLTVQELKRKLEPVTGVSIAYQALSLHRNAEDQELVRQLDDNSKPLGFYSVADWMLIKVADTNPSGSLSGQFTDPSQVEKFEISKEEYANRADTVLAYKKLHQMGRFAPSQDATPGASAADSALPDISVGARCEVVSVEDGLKKRGTVRYVGPTKFGKDQGSTWVGVEYDEPVGKNDGSVQGERYFTSKAGHGAFVRPDKVKTGDFPPVDPFADEEI